MEWISVEDKLPKKYEYVLVVENDEQIDMAWNNGTGFVTEYRTHMKVTHWMPLPEPPKD